jgi:hypothetical protein
MKQMYNAADMRYLFAIPILLLATVLYQGTKERGGDTDTGNTSKHSQKEVRPLPPVADVASAAVGQQNGTAKQNNTDDSGNRVRQWDSRLNAVSTAIIAVLTFLMWRVYRAILHATKITERAWIVADIGLIEKTPQEGVSQVIVELRNNGKTPAWVTAAGSNGWCASEQKLLPDTPIYTEMTPFDKAGKLLPPLASLPQGIAFQKVHMDLAIKEEVVLYVFGYAKYRDIYGNKHLTRYCFQAKPALDLNHPHRLDFYVGGPDQYLKAT